MSIGHLLLGVALSLTIWLSMAACPRPPAAIPFELDDADASWTGKREVPSDGLDNEAPQGKADSEPSAEPGQSEQITPNDATPDQAGPERSREAVHTGDTSVRDGSTEGHLRDQSHESTPEPIACPPPPSKEAVDLLTQWQSLGFATNPQPFTAPRCQAIGFRMVVPAKMEIQVDVTELPRKYAFALAVYNARRINGVATDLPLATKNSAAQTYISLRFTASQSGEYGIVLYGWQHPSPAPFKIQSFCTKQCQRSATRFPIVLMHGFAGTDKYFGLLDYFYKVKPHLEAAGYAAFTPKVQPIANSKQRVLALKKQIDAIFAQTGARKLNLIAHSQGGVDGRLLISSHKYHDKIVSLTTISTPHRGIPVPNLLIPPSQELG